MQGVVYVDILVLVNAIVGYLVLRCVAFLAGREQRPWRMCAAAIFAGLSALLLLWPWLPWPAALLLKLLCAVGIVLVAFRFACVRVFLKTMLWYFAINMLLGGAVALATFCGARNLRYENFSLYVHVSPVLLIACVLLMYVLIQGAAYVFGKPKPQQNITFSAQLQGATLHGTALLDTGMHLRDAMTGESAALCSKPSLQAQLPHPLCETLDAYFASGALCAPLWLVAVKTATGLRMLPAVRAQTLTAGSQTKALAILVFTSETLLDGGCDMLLHPDFLREK